MLKNKLFIIFSVLSLAACTTVPTEPAVDVKTVKVEVPIAVKCKTPTPVPPKYCFPGSLQKSDDIFIKTRCLLSDRKKSLAYELELSTALDTCK